MELREYVAVLRKRWLTITAVTLLLLAAAGVWTVTATPTFTASTSVFFAIRNGSTPQELAQGLTFTESLVASYTRVVTTPAVLEPVIARLGLPDTPAQLANRVSAEAGVNTVILDISVVDDSPEQAARIANAIGAELSVVAAQLSPGSADSAEPLRVTTITPAAVPSYPSAPRTKLTLGLALVLGLIAGCATAVLRALFDTRVHESDVLRVAGEPVIATFAMEAKRSSHLALRDDPNGARAESFRQLRTNLQFINLDEKNRSIAVVSSVSGEGKSETAINLALAMADAETRVLLVDADLRSPSVADYLGLEGAAGLTTVLTGAATLAEVVQPWGDQNLSVLTSGRVPPNPSELLGSRRMAAVLAAATEEYDLVILDSAPILPVTDGAVLARQADGVLLVVGYDRVRQHHVAETVASLGNVGAKLLGVALNRLTGHHVPTQYGYGPVENPDAVSTSSASAPRSDRRGPMGPTRSGRARTGPRRLSRLLRGRAGGATR